MKNIFSQRIFVPLCMTTAENWQQIGLEANKKFSQV